MRPSFLARVGITIVLLLGATCGGRSVPGKRVIVLGFDGMDYGVARDLMAQGRMPNFARAAASGSFSPLGTSIPPQSPVAWSSVITALDSGGHGIFDFIHRDPKTMVPYLSTTRARSASRTLTLGSWQLPLSGARMEQLRDGQPFWEQLENEDVRSRILRMPANFPPSGTATIELSGMGTPDVLGTYGTFSFFSSAPLREGSVSGGRVSAVDVLDNVVRGELAGPDNPFRTPARELTAPFTVYLDPRGEAAKIAIGDVERVLKVGEWSDWVPVEFKMTWFQSLHGISRFYLKRIRPTFELYVSPINFDPAAPAMPLSTPASYAAELARATGPFHTQGIAEETKALSERLLTRDEFLAQAKFVGDEVTRQYWHVLDGFDEGFLFYYFGNLDQVSHMMWRARDPAHPAYDAIADAPYRNVVDDLYVAFDRIVGETLQRTGPDTTLIVMSDHGFTSWRRSFNLNTWLRDHGYLALIDPSLAAQSDLANVDWARTRAYGLGLNGLYINLRGREQSGIVAPEDRNRLVEEIRRGLLATIDPQTGRPAVSKAYSREQAYHGAQHFDVAPDVIVLYAGGTRVSNESALGGVPAEVIVDNTGEWSGDHCMDPDAVPGILLANRPLRERPASLEQVPRAILAEFGIAARRPAR